MSDASMTTLRRAPDRLFEKTGSTNDRLPGLAVVYENLSAAVGTEIEALSRFKPKVAFEPSNKESSLEFCQHRVGKLAAILECRKTEAKALFIVDRNFMDWLLHKTFNGADEASPIPIGRVDDVSFTSIERSLLRKLAEGIAKNLDVIVKEAVETDFVVDRVEQVASAQLLGKRNIDLSTVRFQLQGVSIETECSFGVAHSLIQLGYDKFAEEPKEEETSVDPKWMKDLHEGVSTTPVLLNGVLEEVEVTLGDLGRLKPGSVLELQGGGMGRILLESAGQKLFWCKVEQSEGKYVLEIEEPF